MDFKEIMQSEKVDFSGIETSYFLLGLLSAFDNRFQAVADRSIGIVSWKQFFAIICVNMCREAPTVKELAEIMGSSHQNVKQILLKLEKKGFVRISADNRDRRKQRIFLTEECMEFCQKNDKISTHAMEAIFSGIPEEQLLITVKTIMQMEDNLKRV